MNKRNATYNRKNRYPDGYMPKISYWQYKMTKAIEDLDPSAIEFAAQRLQYFVGRQNEIHNKVMSCYS